MKCRGKALCGVVGTGLRPSVAGGSLRGWRIRPGTSAGSLGPKWAGKTLAVFPSDPPICRGSLPIPVDPLTVGGPLPSMGIPPLPQPPFRGTSPVCPASTFPPPSLPYPQDPCGQRGPQRAEDQVQYLRRLPRAQVGRGNSDHIPFLASILPRIPPPSVDPLMVGGPLQAWEPLPSPSQPSGAPALSCLHFSSALPSPTSYPVTGGVLPSPLVSVAPHQCLVCALVVRRHKLHVLLLCHLDSAPRKGQNI